MNTVLRPVMRTAGTLLLALLPWLAAVPVHAQTERTIDGRTFTVHVVEQGQTLYAISRAHAVPVDALLQANPDAARGLAIGQEVLVPQDAVVRKEARSAPTLLRDGELQHIVARKETLFGIARKYEVDINALLQRNPEANAGLRPGMVVIIPPGMGAAQPPAVTRPAAPEGMRMHVVQPGETLYGLARRYAVAAEAIQEANNGLPEGLKAGMSVLVPIADEGPVAPFVVEDPVPDRLYTVGLLLPFAHQRNDSVLAQAPPGGPARYHEASRIAAQFYAGALMAIDSAKAAGLRAEVHVIDTGDDARAWGPAVRTVAAAGMDLCIGPFHRQAIEELARLAPATHIVCPVPQSNKVILGHANVSKVVPTRTDLLRFTARHVALRHNRDHVVLLRPDIHGEKDGQDLMERTLREAMAARPGTFGDSLIIARPGRRDLGDLPAKLHASRLNVLLAPGEDLEYVATLVTKLRALVPKYRIMLVGLESWPGMTTISPTDLDRLQFTFATGSFIAHGTPATDRFVRGFQDRFGHDVDDYALLGYDVTRYYLDALHQEGRALVHAFDTLRGEGLHMGFRMTRTGPENGFRNEAAIMVQQHEMRLVRVP